MSDHDEVIALAFERVRKQGPPKIGVIVGVRDKKYPLAYKLVGVEGGEAICALPDGSQIRFPLQDIADVNEVKRVALDIYVRGQIEAIKVRHSLSRSQDGPPN